MAENWQRIGDDDFAPFGKRVIRFKRSDTGQEYAVHVDEANQYAIMLAIGDVVLNLDIERKFHKGGLFEISGGVFDPTGALDIGEHNVAWGELILTTPATLNFWGNKVIVRTDNEVGGAPYGE